MLTVMPIGATQLGWYLYDQQTGFDFGMIVGTSTVIYAAWLMYEKGWREEDEDESMEKIIFFALVIPIIGFVLYLGANAVMKGFSAKEANRSEKDETTLQDDFSADKKQLSNELSKLNELLQSGALTQEEFQKAKDKILNS